MSKIKFNKKILSENRESELRRSLRDDRMLCQFEIPGVGRIRTGESHANFHLTGDIARRANRLNPPAKTGKDSAINEETK